MFHVITLPADRHSICLLAKKYNQETKLHRFSICISDNLHRDEHLADQAKEFLNTIFETSESKAIQLIINRPAVCCILLIGESSMMRGRRSITVEVVIGVIVFMGIRKIGSYVFYVATTKDNLDKRFGSKSDGKPFRDRGIGHFLLKLAQGVSNAYEAIASRNLFMSVSADEGLEEYYLNIGFQNGWNTMDKAISKALQFSKKFVLYDALVKLSFISSDQMLTVDEFPMDHWHILITQETIDLVKNVKLSEDLDMLPNFLDWINTSIDTVLDLPKVLKRDIFHTVDKTRSGDYHTYERLAFGSIIGLSLRVMFRTNLPKNIAVLGGRQKYDLFVNMICEKANDVHLIRDNNKVYFCCARCGYRFEQSIAEDTVNLFAFVCETFINTHVLGLESKMERCSNVMKQFPLAYEYYHSLASRDAMNMYTEEDVLGLYERTAAVFSGCCEKATSYLKDFYSRETNKELKEMQIVSFADTISAMALLPAGDHVNLGVRQYNSLAQEVYLRNVIAGETLPNALEIIHENDWSTVPADTCCLTPIKETCNCIPDPTTENMCCIDDDCYLRAMNVECSPNCNAKDRCGNQRIRNASFAFIQMFSDDVKGCGLVTTQTMKPDEFIIEYVGVVKQKRSENNE